ncbi:MAG TPA: hypothetical protein VG371_08550 [Solirubrobacteraceae bacterium]|nr:hypothetical protein [Solirubrobacteraceae bacterium]
MNVDGAGQQEGIAVVQGARWVRRPDVLDPAVGERETGADGGSVRPQDVPANLLAR